MFTQKMLESGIWSQAFRTTFWKVTVKLHLRHIGKCANCFFLFLWDFWSKWTKASLTNWNYEFLKTFLQILFQRWSCEQMPQKNWQCLKTRKRWTSFHACKLKTSILGIFLSFDMVSFLYSPKNASDRDLNSWLKCCCQKDTQYKLSTEPKPKQKLEIILRGLHGTEVAFLHLTQQPRARFTAFPKFFTVIFQYRWDELAALLRVKWTETWKCQSNPSSTGKWQASTPRKI